MRFCLSRSRVLANQPNGEKMPRHKKDAATKNLEGSYRKDRDGTSNQASMTELIQVLPPVPSVIKTAYVKAAWKAQLSPLVTAQRFGLEDMVVLQEAFRSLDMAQRFQEKIDAMNDDDPRFASYASLVKNYRQQWFEIMRKFAVTPYDRMAMREILSGRIKPKGTADRMTE